jgi:hypothetical protein
MAGFFGARIDAAGKEIVEPSPSEKIVRELIDPTKPLGERLAVSADGRDRQDQLRRLYTSLRGRIERISESFGKDYAEYEAKKEPVGDKIELTAEKERELIDSFRDLVNDFEAFSTVRIEAETIARGWEPVRKFFGEAWRIAKDWCNLPRGPGIRMMTEAKAGGSVAQALAAIPGFIVLLSQTASVLGLAAITGIPAFTLSKQLLNGFLGTAGGVFGGDPGPSIAPPATGKSSGSILPLLGFGVAIAMITGGKSVFDAIGKTVGGFFQFATALMPGSKKKGAKGAGPGGGGRRGPKVDVDQWVENLEAAQRRLEKAKEDSNKGAERVAQREIDRAIDKLKKAKDEGEDVPDGLWNLGSFNWLG